jgi:hypothetical protein
MRAFFAGLKRWYQRRIRGFVAAPAGSGGTSWLQHRTGASFIFRCRCGEEHLFGNPDFFVRARDHRGDCVTKPMGLGELINDCNCPITDARYCWKCPKCGLGHWMDATSEIE